MAYSHTLAELMRPLILPRPGTIEKNMFGGIAFFVNGNICCGIYKDQLILRVGPDAMDKALRHKHVRPMDITGRPMKGWVMVEPEGYEDPAELLRWIERAFDFASLLQPKGAKR